MKFVKATKKQAHARVALVGVSGSGKTYSALRIMRGLIPTGRIAVIDSERGSASKYSDKFEFHVLELESFSPLTYVQAIESAAAEGFEGLILDSISHAWMGKDGALEQVDRRAGAAGSSFNAWRDVTPMQTKMIDALVRFPGHLVATMRSKAEYVVEQNGKGKSQPRKVGMAPVQREGLEYEFDVVINLNNDNSALVDKTRCSALNGGAYELLTEAVGETLRAWLTDGAPMPAPAAKAAPAAGGKLPDPPAKDAKAAEPAKAAADKPFDMGPALLAIARATTEAELRDLPRHVVGTPSEHQLATLREIGAARLKELRAAAAEKPTAAADQPAESKPAADQPTSEAPPAPQPTVEPTPAAAQPSPVVQFPDKGWTEFLADIGVALGADTAAWTEEDITSEFAAVLGSVDSRSNLTAKALPWIASVNRRSGARVRPLRDTLKDMFDARSRELAAADRGQAGAS